MQLSIFDVDDLNDPKLAHRYSFGGGRSTASIALGDHRAVSYFPSAEILAIPVYSAYQGGGFDNTAILGAEESALQVFRIDVATGFEPIATIKHDSRIVRSLRVGEQLIVVSADQITIHDINDPSQTLAELDLQIGSDEGLVELTTYFSPQMLAAIQVLTTSSAEGLVDRVAASSLATREFSAESETLALAPSTETKNLRAIDVSLATLGTTENVETVSDIDSRSSSFAILKPEFQKALDEIFAASGN